MNPRLWSRKSFKVFIALVAILLVLAPFSLANTDVSNMHIKDVSKYDNGATVFAGEEVIDNTKVNKYPLAINIDYLFGQFLSGDIIGGFYSIATGTVPIPASELVEGDVTNTGLVSEFNGPGYMEFKNNKIIVHAPKNSVWGYSEPYLKAVKTPEGINIYNAKANTTLEHIASDSINNDTIKEEYLPSGDELKDWYDTAEPGDAYTLNYGVSNFNDGRGYITADQLKQYFPKAYNYSLEYPNGSPIEIYRNGALDEIVVSSASTSLGDHSEYGANANTNREFNARQFCLAWNNTVIPPNATACGKQNIGFTSIKDKEADGGWASHGVCPPARALRNAVMELGIELPVGLNGGENCVNYGVSPSTGVKVTNNLNYPIKLIMWTEGSGTGMIICCKVIGYKSPYDNAQSNTNSTENSTTE